MSMTTQDDGFMLSGDAMSATEPTADMPDSWPADDIARQGAKSGDEALYLELEGWEGPLDLLLVGFHQRLLPA